MAKLLRPGVYNLRCTWHGRHQVGAVRLGTMRVARCGGPSCRRSSTRLFASEAPPKSDSSFSQNLLLENLKSLRFGLQRRIVSSSPTATVDEELDQRTREGLCDGNILAVNVERDAGTCGDEGLLEEERDLGSDDAKRAHLTSPGFSFSAGGHLFPYHLGVCKCLMEHGYITENTPLAGSSAGALVCAVVAGGLEMSDALDAAKEVSQDCRANGTAFRVGAVLRGIMEKYLPNDIHTRVNGRIRVAVTQVFRQPMGLLVDHFVSKEDFIDALHTSCFIPGYFAPRPVTIFRNRICIDGGFTFFMPPTAAEETIRICPFFTSVYKIPNVQISPDCNPTDSRPGNQMLLNLAFTPAEDAVLDEIFQSGYEDASSWVNDQSR